MIDFEFVGTMSARLSITPNDFSGMPFQQIVEELEHDLMSLNPGVTFFHDDIVLAAERIIEELK